MKDRPTRVIAAAALGLSLIALGLAGYAVQSARSAGADVRTLATALGALTERGVVTDLPASQGLRPPRPELEMDPR